MRRKSHHMLGIFLAERYLRNIRTIQRKVFLFGCTEPDFNPSTYLKGSIRAKWLRGHNFENANHFAAHLAERLENKQQYSMWDYYSLGKLLHYTADAFTLAHNAVFPPDIQQHREYEAKLQDCFLSVLPSHLPENAHPELSVHQYVLEMHDRYLLQPPGIETDICYILMVCCTVVQKLTAQRCGNAKDSTSLLGKSMVF